MLFLENSTTRYVPGNWAATLKTRIAPANGLILAVPGSEAMSAPLLQHHLNPEYIPPSTYRPLVRRDRQHTNSQRTSINWRIQFLSLNNLTRISCLHFMCVEVCIYIFPLGFPLLYWLNYKGYIYSELNFKKRLIEACSLGFAMWSFACELLDWHLLVGRAPGHLFLSGPAAAWWRVIRWPRW